jgi:hypothetical protein
MSAPPPTLDVPEVPEVPPPTDMAAVPAMADVPNVIRRLLESIGETVAGDIIPEVE